jgi:hypothetical protein
LQSAVVAEWYGEWRNGDMQTHAISKNPQGTTIRTMIRFFDINADRFARESTYGVDDGNTWLRAASLIATRV